MVVSCSVASNSNEKGIDGVLESLKDPKVLADSLREQITTFIPPTTDDIKDRFSVLLSQADGARVAVQGKVSEVIPSFNIDLDSKLRAVKDAIAQAQSGLASGVSSIGSGNVDANELLGSVMASVQSFRDQVDVVAKTG